MLHRSRVSALVIPLIFSLSATAKQDEHDWKTGRVLDESAARIYAGTYDNSSASASSYGSTVNASGSGYSTPIYRVYDNLVIQGDDFVYVTSERLRWRWSKGAHVAVNEEVKYYVEGRKLHILDDDGKEHTVEVIREVKRLPETPPALASPPASPVPSEVSIGANVPNCDIEVDGAFMGNTPSTLSLESGKHTITVEKKGYVSWERTVMISGSDVHLDAELEAVAH